MAHVFRGLARRLYVGFRSYVLELRLVSASTGSMQIGRQDFMIAGSRKKQ